MAATGKRVLETPEIWYRVRGDDIEPVKVLAVSAQRVWLASTSSWRSAETDRNGLMTYKTTSWYTIVATFGEAKSLVLRTLEARLQRYRRDIEFARQRIPAVRKQISRLGRLQAPVYMEQAPVCGEPQPNRITSEML